MTTAAACAHGPAHEHAGRVQLPKTLAPTHYALCIAPSLDDFAFHGRVDIDIRVLEATDTVVLNALDLDIATAVARTADGRELTPAKPPAYDTAEQTVTLAFPERFAQGAQLRLHLEFTGAIREQMAGFYRSKYQTPDGATKYCAVTQFEAVDARRALPCFDEPALKATFDLTLSVAPHLTALANTDVVREAHDDANGRKVVTFATSPVMSTYLLAWCIGELDYIEAFTTPTPHLPTPVRVRTYTTKGLVHQGKFALGVAVKALEWFSEQFGVPYPLSKCDQIAVPDFNAGAMENWGLITYRTVALLVDDEHGAMKSKKWVASTVCHELAHQWFGNLVTFQEWDELWLNEGFATWAGTAATAHLFPEWNFWTQFLSDEQASAFELDGLRSSHPIQVPVLDPKEIMEIFDDISYAKGASVIHMLTRWLGVESFLRGIRSYLAAFAYKNATTEDLWHHLSQASGKDVRAFMATWTGHVGYPVVHVNEQPLPDQGAKGVRLCCEQKRYLVSGDATAEENATLWPVPLNIATVEPAPLGTRVVADTVMTTKKLNVDLIAPSAHPVYLVNYDRSALYRVCYSDAALSRLTSAIRSGQVATRDRYGIFQDTFAMVQAAAKPTSAFLHLVASALADEAEYIVFEHVSAAFAELRHAWSAAAPAPILAAINDLRRAVFAPHAHKYGFDAQPGESALVALMRPILVDNAGDAGDKGVLAEARARFARLVAGDLAAVPSDLYGPVLALGVKYGGAAEWEGVERVFGTTPDIDLRYAALRALGATRHVALVHRALELSIDPQRNRPQDLHYIWGTLSANRDARDALWTFFCAHYALLEDRYGPEFLNLIPIVMRFCVADAHLDVANAFFATKDTKAYERRLAEALDHARAAIAWYKRDHAVVTEWFEDQAVRAKYGF